jgi:hypothetical protein
VSKRYDASNDQRFLLVVASFELVCKVCEPADLKGYDVSAGEHTCTRF